MTKPVLLNFADACYAGYQSIANYTGRLFGVDDQILSFSPQDIDVGFRRENADILACDRGAGYWLWKPYFLDKALAELPGDALLLYADAGMHFVNSVDPMVKLMDAERLDLLVLGEGFVESQYTKRDAFTLMGADRRAITTTPQRFASAMLLRNTQWSRDFVERYLGYATDRRILTDDENCCGAGNYPDFVAHRHDQSIFSIMTKQAKVPCPDQRFVIQGMPTRRNQILNHTRAQLKPGAILAGLLAQSVLNSSDLEILAQGLFR